MTKQVIKLVWPVAVVVALAVSSVPAQAADIRCTVPFSFTVKGKTLPPGTYEISDTNGGALFVRGLQDGAVALGMRTESRESRARLVFHKYGDTYVLRQAWTGSLGREIPESSQERELARAAQGGQVAGVERVVIPAL